MRVSTQHKHRRKSPVVNKIEGELGERIISLYKKGASASYIRRVTGLSVSAIARYYTRHKNGKLSPPPFKPIETANPVANITIKLRDKELVDIGSIKYILASYDQPGQLRILSYLLNRIGNTS